jgi:hypothetical protein
MYRSIPLLLLAIADLALGLRWLWLGGRVVGHADGTGEGMIGGAIFAGGIVTMAMAGVLLAIARRAQRFSRETYVPVLALCLMIGGLPWLAFATIP